MEIASDVGANRHLSCFCGILHGSEMYSNDWKAECINGTYVSTCERRRATALAAKGLTNLSEAELKEYFALLVRVGERKVLKRAYESVFDVSESKEASSSYKPHNADSSQQKRQQTDQGKARQGKKKRRR
jgi:hypothetical protein